MGTGAVVSHSTDIYRMLRIVVVLIFFKRKEISQSKETSLAKEMELKDTLESFIVSSNTLHSEIPWSLKVVMFHFLLRSCTDLSELFKVMFKDNEIAKGFAPRRTKCTYLINFGVAPYFREELISSIKTSPHFFASFDEYLNRVLQDDQMEIQIRFLDESDNIVSARYFDSKFLKRPNAEKFVSELNNSLSERPLKNMHQLSMDGPSTNWKVLELLNNHPAESEIPQLLPKL